VAPLLQTDPASGMACLRAPARWQSVLLMSDLHLQADDLATFAAWRAQVQACQADALLLLGDVFEIWVGDDALPQDPFLQAALQVLQDAATERTVAVMRGNRDFLMGDAMLAAHGLHALPDPCILDWSGPRMLLTHGDALCLADEGYQRFRALSRSPDWQAAFLAKPLSERLALAQQMRMQSQAHQAHLPTWADADPAMSAAWLAQAQCQHLVHGHTHQPAEHALGTARRHVLSDWDLRAQPPRAQLLTVHADGRLLRRDVASAA